MCVFAHLAWSIFARGVSFRTPGAERTQLRRIRAEFSAQRSCICSATAAYGCSADTGSDAGNVFLRASSSASSCSRRSRSSVNVLDGGVWPVSATGGFRVPLALVIFVLDCFRVAWDLLFLGGRPRGGQGLGMSREWF